MTHNMTTRKCCIRFCHKTRSENVVLHKFPNPETDIERFEAWTNAVGGDLIVTEKSSVYRLYRICDTHFDAKYKSGSGRVTSNAVPTLFLSAQPSLVQRQPVPQATYAVSNRTYSRQTTSEILPQNIPSTSEEPITVAQQPTIELAAAKTHRQSATRKQHFSTTTELKKNKFIPADVAALHNKIKKLQESKESYKSKLKRAMKLSENPSFLKALKKNSTFATIFTMLQFREAVALA